MKFHALFLSSVTLIVGVMASPTSAGLQVRRVEHRANEVARAPRPIPFIPNIDPATKALFKREAVKEWVFGGHQTKKSAGKAVIMKAEFNETAGSSWCNEIDGVGKDDQRENIITKAHVDSHLGYSNPGPESRPPEYVCFFYESRHKCDPKDGHAEYVESVVAPKASQGNDTEFDTTKYKYIRWGCTWHPLNEKCEHGDNGTGHKPGEKCNR
ncbi:hypothetical protein PMIN06_008348 [Paraphaeosphaeria minitans]|uniref:Uncharacterized protein n=1 Tax=Paraphaeosphaeria minitans TaxID=565426 RepID=A0A9P6KVM3_9PLEO|nr:hypothetical protein PMIN01_00652 [Paraphaeosphaeria minitans]